MSDSEEQERSTVQRFGLKNRKRRLDPRGPLFPVEEKAEPEVSSPLVTPADPPSQVTEPPPISPPAAAKPPGADHAGRFPPLSIEPHISTTADSSAAPAPVRRRSTCLPNLITIIFALGTVGIIALYSIIAVNPYTPLNPFPPFTPLPIILTATFLPPTATLPPTPGPTPSFTPLAVEKPPTPAFRFTLASTLYAPNGNDQGCDWSSIAGTVTSRDGLALDGYSIHIVGEDLDQTVFTGTTLTFGSGGFELFLNGVPQEKPYMVQLLSPQGEVLSDLYPITTRAACDQNVVILTFAPTGS